MDGEERAHENVSRRRAVSAFHCTDTASASTVLALPIDTATGAGDRLSCRTTCTNEGNATANDTICAQLAAVSNEPYPRNATLISRCEAILVGSTWLSTQNGAAQQLRSGHRDVLAFTGRPERRSAHPGGAQVEWRRAEEFRPSSTPGAPRATGISCDKHRLQLDPDERCAGAAEGTVPEQEVGRAARVTSTMQPEPRHPTRLKLVGCSGASGRSFVMTSVKSESRF